MDDKIELATLMTKIASSLNAMEASVKEITDCLLSMRRQAEAELKQRQLQLKAISETPTPQDYMSGRWRRRDGDGFATPPALKQVEAAPDGDGKTGDIRPPY